MKHDRINTTLEEIANPWLSGDRAGSYLQQISDVLTPTNKTAIEAALHLGHRLNLLPDETLRRHALRACLLAEFTVMNKPVTLRDNLSSQLEKLSKDQLVRQFQSRFPLISSNNKRDSWAETNFTDPAQHANQAFRYIVHGMKRPAEDGSSTIKHWQLLATPTIIQNWVAISCSVLDQTHRATYRPYGLILRVPKSNILTTHSADQMFSNHAGAEVPVDASAMDRIRLAAEIKNHIIGKDAEYGGLKTPAEILQATQQGSKNEIVVMGTSPEQTKVTVAGIYVKVDTNGAWHQDLLNDPGLQALRNNITNASSTLGIPVVLIQD
jgi:hypothetical protein